jgi:uncharacterized protein (UPF0335 family)
MDTALGPDQASALRSYADRVVSMHEERDTLNGDIREVYKEAKDGGFDTTTLREIVREMRMEPDARSSRYAMLETYRAALGLLADMPLGEAAMDRAAQEAPAPRAARPRPFAEQPIKARGRGRPRKPRPMDFLPDAEAAGSA